MNNIKKEERQSNFELMKIISMFMIIIWHIIIHTSAQYKTTGLLNLIIWFIYIAFAIHVNSFIICTGYFQYKGKFKIKKVWEIFSSAWFYRIVFAIIFLFIETKTFSHTAFFNEIIPFNINNEYWFINGYLVLYALTPFINIVIEKLTRKEHKYLIYLLIFIFSIIQIITLDKFIYDTSYSIPYFIYMYLIGAYLGKYKTKDNILFKEMSIKKRRLIFISLTIFFAILNFLIFIFTKELNNYNNGLIIEFKQILENNIIQYRNPILILESIFYFLYFETINIKSKFINYVSTLTLGIYMLHENHHVYNNLYNYIGFTSKTTMSSNTFILKIFALGIIIFIVCGIIEAIRKVIFRFLSKLKINKKIKNYIKNYANELTT